jgi:UDP-3-O-[3-hydroxymyristoyl] N-acetylglucosamine deacetylase
MRYALQHTVHSAARWHGVGLHSGAPVTLVVRPAPVNSGIVFRRTDLPHRPTVAALWHAVEPSPLCTTLVGEDGTRIATIEHLMAALSALGVDNAVAELNGPEVPILDGSAAPFLDTLRSAGVRQQTLPRRFIRVARPVQVKDGNRTVSLHPADSPLADTLDLTVVIDFPSAAIGRQEGHLRLSSAAFLSEVSYARTFGFAEDVARMKAAGLGQGGSLANAVVVEGDRVLNPEGLRAPDEFVRHKLLDAVGDLYLAGAPLIGAFYGERCGHYMNYRLLEALFSDEDNWSLETFTPARMRAVAPVYAVA